MSKTISSVDPDGLLEYSVVYTDRALNHMSRRFQDVMRDISNTLKEVYNASAVVVIPGSGTFGMEAVARQFATDKTCLVLRNGWFSYRWSQIFAMGDIPSHEIVLKAQATEADSQPSFAPAPLSQAIRTIQQKKPAVVFAPHVETSAGMMLPNQYLKSIGEAVHSIGGLFVLDCIASGTMWVDMVESEVDVLITAPQKGWSGSPCAAMVLLSERAVEKMNQTTSTSFACNLAKWHHIMRTYEEGGHAYYTTMPTDGLRTFRDVMMEAKTHGFSLLKDRQQELGGAIRDICSQRFKSVAASGFTAPSVVVCYTNNPAIQSGSAFSKMGMQIAAGVPLQCDEPAPFQTFRLGLFGLDKLLNIDRTVQHFEDVFNRLP